MKRLTVFILIFMAQTSLAMRLNGYRSSTNVERLIQPDANWIQNNCPHCTQTIDFLNGQIWGHGFDTSTIQEKGMPSYVDLSFFQITPDIIGLYAYQDLRLYPKKRTFNCANFFPHYDRTLSKKEETLDSFFRQRKITIIRTTLSCARRGRFERVIDFLSGNTPTCD